MKKETIVCDRCGGKRDVSDLVYGIRLSTAEPTYGADLFDLAGVVGVTRIDMKLCKDCYRAAITFILERPGNFVGRLGHFFYRFKYSQFRYVHEKSHHSAALYRPAAQWAGAIFHNENGRNQS